MKSVLKKDRAIKKTITKEKKKAQQRYWAFI
jgi:hypothetical protein